MAVAVSKGRRGDLGPRDRPFLVTLGDAEAQRTGVSAQPALQSPQVLKAGIKAWCTQSLFIVSPNVQRPGPCSRPSGPCNWPLFRAGDIKWPVTPVQFSYSPESSGGRKWLCLSEKTQHHIPASLHDWPWGRHGEAALAEPMNTEPSELSLGAGKAALP